MIILARLKTYHRPPQDELFEKHARQCDGHSSAPCREPHRGEPATDGSQVGTELHEGDDAANVLCRNKFGFSLPFTDGHSCDETCIHDVEQHSRADEIGAHEVSPQSVAPSSKRSYYEDYKGPLVQAATFASRVDFGQGYPTLKRSASHNGTSLREPLPMHSIRGAAHGLDIKCCR